MALWQISDLDGNTIIVLSDIHKVADYEYKLRNEVIGYTTRMFLNNKPVSKFGEKVTGNMVHYSEI